MLENPAVCKDKDTRDAIFALLGTLVQKYNHVLGAVTSIVHLLPHFEHLAVTMAQLVQVVVTEYESPAIVGEVSRFDSHSIFLCLRATCSSRSLQGDWRH
jgi:condensin complex subunit 1